MTGLSLLQPTYGDGIFEKLVWIHNYWSFFSGNIAIGVVLFVVYLIVGYVIGLIMFLLGAVRYIQLRLMLKDKNAVRT